MGQHSGEQNGVLDAPARQEGRLLRANDGLQSLAEAVGQAGCQDAVISTQQSDGPMGCTLGYVRGAILGYGRDGAQVEFRWQLVALESSIEDTRQ
jgi:hypothetical protein